MGRSVSSDEWRDTQSNIVCSKDKRRTKSDKIKEKIKDWANEILRSKKRSWTSIVWRSNEKIETLATQAPLLIGPLT